jgi:23S rRNA (uracil1939-C5)-methyltransferase
LDEFQILKTISISKKPARPHQSTRKTGTREYVYKILFNVGNCKNAEEKIYHATHEPGSNFNVEMGTKTILIEKMVHGGLGLSRTDEGVVFVEAVMPGETVEIVIAAGSRVRGSPVVTSARVVEPSPKRRQPVCPMFGTCGGCDWMHMAYETQLSIKEGIFRETCARIGRISDIGSLAVFASPELGYRRRVQFKVDPGNKETGFFRKKSNDIAALSRCPLLCQPLNELLCSMPAHFDKMGTGVRELKALYGDMDVSLCAGKTVASSPVIQGLTGPTTVIRCESYAFPVSGSGFFQANLFLAPKLGMLAAEWCIGETFLDLYGGSGFFSVFVAKKFARGFCVETGDDHIAKARETFSRNGITSVTAEKSAVLDFLRRAVLKKLKADCCIVDPPRTGLEPGVAAALADLGPQQILYVSCDPATQARDTGFLINQCGYRCEKAALVDCYPQTHHLETVMLLSRKR